MIDNGTCGTCGGDAEATQSNEGYSDCCNDRIEYGEEASETKRRVAGEQDAQAKGRDAYVALDVSEVEVVNSWGLVEKRAKITGTTVYYGKPATIYIDADGYDGLVIDSENRLRATWEATFTATEKRF